MWSKRILIIKSPVCILVKVITIIDNPELIAKTSNDCYSLHWNMISNVTHRRDIKSPRISCFKPNEILQRFLAYWSVYICRWDSIIYASVYCFRSLLICLLCLYTKLQLVLWYSPTLCRCCYKYTIYSKQVPIIRYNNTVQTCYPWCLFTKYSLPTFRKCNIHLCSFQTQKEIENLHII